MAALQHIPDQRPGYEACIISNPTSRKRQKIWGTTQADLQTVYITIKDSNIYKTKIPSKFSAVYFTYYTGLKDQTKAIVQTYYNCCLHTLAHNIEEHLEDIDTILNPLKDQIMPLRNMVHSLPRDPTTWNIFEDDILPLGLCRTIRTAFLFNMNGAHGKDAVCSLLTEIIKYLNLEQTLSVTSKGSSSSVNDLATSVSMKVVQDISSNNTKFYGDDNKVTTQLNLNSPKSENSTDSYCKKKCKEDVLVYYSPETLDAPIQTRLVVIVNHGHRCDETAILTALMSRLPYQTGAIFGLSINAIGAALYSVECVKDHETDSDVVNISVYQEYSFSLPNQPFSVKSFWNMIRDIGFILKIQSSF